MCRGVRKRQKAHICQTRQMWGTVEGEVVERELPHSSQKTA